MRICAARVVVDGAMLKADAIEFGGKLWLFPTGLTRQTEIDTANAHSPI
jgi:hypothetical protein